MLVNKIIVKVLWLCIIDYFLKKICWMFKIIISYF